MYIIFGIIASVYGMLAVVLGAFGAHALKTKLDLHQHQIYDKAVHYQFFHVAALLAVFVLSKFFPSKSLSISGWCFSFGILFFSGSLYLLATLHLTNLQSIMPIIGPITPIGGLLFILGWLFLLLSIVKIK